MTDTQAQTLESEIEALIGAAIAAYVAEVAPDQASEIPEWKLEQPKRPEHGDWACSVAMKLARVLRRKPQEIAEGIAARVPANALIAPPEVVPPGFINLRIATGAVNSLIGAVLEQGEAFGRVADHAGQRVLIEFVSANPTGPLHIGHGRGAILGDALARLFAATGYEISREYYYNDAGVQMQNLGATLRARYLQAVGVQADMPENGYKGDYMIDLGKQLVAERGDALVNEGDLKPFTDYAAGHIIEWIKADLETLKITFDTWFSETTLHTGGKVAAVLEQLKQDGRIYEKDGALWLKTQEYGDDQDRVVVKSDGPYTYLAPDIAYHEYKFERGFDRLVNVLGADHHGYVPRLKAAIQSIGYKSEQLDCPLVQMVGVLRGGEPVKLSTRAGDFITLKEVLDEIGADVVRFMFLMRSSDSQMTFDFDVAKQVSMDNPYYYVQYAHARCCSILAKAESEGHAWQGADAANLARLTTAEEQSIARQMDRLPGVVRECVKVVDAMPMTAYLRDVATAFHGFYTAGSRDASLRVLQEDAELTQARLTLIAALRQVLANGLRMIGVEPLERL